MKEYFVTYGCYLEKDCAKVITDLPIGVVNMLLYDLAYEATAGWVGIHDFDLDEDYSNEYEYEEALHELIENAVEYYAEHWVDEEHADQCTYGYDNKPTELKL